MHILLVQCSVKADRIDDFIAVTKENARGSRREPGVVRFDVVQDLDDPTHFTLIEIYHNADGLAAHREAPHYKVWVEKATDLLAAPRTRAIYRNIDPPDSEW